MNNFFDSLLRSFNVELPKDLETLDQHLDFIIPIIKPWSEDLREEKFWHHTRWKQVSDEDAFREAVLHIFLPEGEYLNSLEGNVKKGSWRILEGTNTFIWDRAKGDEELYDLVFLNGDFFILKKHGQHKRKYFFMGKEGAVAGIEWRNVMEKMFNLYRNNNSFLFSTFIIIALIAIILVISLIWR